jgi:acyl-CoA synthetase (NDP forming)
MSGGFMKAFMEPESVALIGISRKSGPGSFNIMENMLTYGYRGKIFPVNPKAREILGTKVFPTIRAVRQEVDLAVISSPRENTLSILEDCVAARVKAAIIVNQGYADADDEGKKIQQGIVEIARRGGMRVLGPNTLGVVNNFNGFTTSFMPIGKERTPVGLICQSGIFFVGAAEFSGTIGKGIDLGNACDIGFYDALKYLSEDPDIKIIAIHMEGLNQAREFVCLAAQVIKEKPIILLKTGSSEKGAASAMTHSGTMAGNYQVYRAALKQAGVTFLEEDGRMIYAVKTLRHLPPMKGSNVAVITFSGAAGIMISDALERHGLRLSSLEPHTVRAAAELSPEWMPLGNPLDIWPAVMKHGTGKAYSIALRAAMNDPNVDGVICVAIAPRIPDFSFLDVSEALNEVMEDAAPKPVVAWLYGPNPLEISKHFEAKSRIMTYPSLELATWALSLLRERYNTVARNAGGFREAEPFSSKP